MLTSASAPEMLSLVVVSFLLAAVLILVYMTVAVVADVVRRVIVNIVRRCQRRWRRDRLDERQSIGDAPATRGTRPGPIDDC